MSTHLNNKAPTGIEALSETKSKLQNYLPDTLAKNAQEVKTLDQLQSSHEVGEATIEIMGQLSALLSAIANDDRQAKSLAMLGKYVIDEWSSVLGFSLERVEGFLKENARPRYA